MDREEISQLKMHRCAQEKEKTEVHSRSTSQREKKENQLFGGLFILDQNLRILQ